MPKRKSSKGVPVKSKRPAIVTKGNPRRSKIPAQKMRTTKRKPITKGKVISIRKKHVSLTAPYMISSKSYHGIWIPNSICHGIILHKPGRPGVVVAHRAGFSRDIPEGSSNRLLKELISKDRPAFAGHVRTSEDIVDTMVRAILNYRRNPRNLKLTFVARKGAPKETRADLIRAAKHFKRLGIISDYGFKLVGENEVAWVNAKTGRVHIDPINIKVLDQSVKHPNKDWKERI